jgi:aminoglycoside 3-N-acetyltransferase
MITKTEFVEQLQQVGLCAGDHVLVHSSLRKVGPIDGGADALLDALLEVVGRDGTVAVPSFHGTRPCPQPCFDESKTPGKTGILGERLRSRPEALRSIHPSHSLVATGPRAAEFLDDHLRVEAVGIGSPFDRLAKAGGLVLLIGLTHQLNTTIHCGEAYAGTKKFFWNDGPLPIANVRRPDGFVVEHQLDCSASCSLAFNAVDLPLRFRELLQDFRLGNAAACLMKGQDVIDATVSLLNQSRCVLFCTRMDCRPCTRGREHVRKCGEMSESEDTHA